MSRDNFDRSKTLDQLERTAGGAPEYDSYLVQTCNRLRGKPLIDYTVEDIRIMVGQNIGLKHLVPLALDVLGENPKAEGDFYEGDLLKALLSVEHSFWKKFRQYPPVASGATARRTDGGVCPEDPKVHAQRPLTSAYVARPEWADAVGAPASPTQCPFRLRMTPGFTAGR